MRYRRAAERRLLAPQGIEVRFPPVVKPGHSRLVSVRQLDQCADLAVVRLQHGVVRGTGTRQCFDDSSEPVDSFVRSHAPHSIYGGCNSLKPLRTNGQGVGLRRSRGSVRCFQKQKAPPFGGAFLARSRTTYSLCAFLPGQRPTDSASLAGTFNGNVTWGPTDSGGGVHYDPTISINHVTYSGNNLLESSQKCR